MPNRFPTAERACCKLSVRLDRIKSQKRKRTPPPPPNLIALVTLPPDAGADLTIVCHRPAQPYRQTSAAEPGGGCILLALAVRGVTFRLFGRFVDWNGGFASSLQPRSCYRTPGI